MNMDAHALASAYKLQSLNFDYRITRSQRKTLALHVKEEDSKAVVEVKAPFFVSQQDIHEWVAEKNHWVETQLATQQQQMAEKPDISNEGSLLFFGEPRLLRTQVGKPFVVEHPEYLLVSHSPNQQAQTVLENWLKTEAKLYIEQRCIELANTMGLTDNISHIGFRKTKSKWGHCTSTGRLQFNWLIIMAPVEVIDYLLVHELSHLVHMNHSKNFWQLVRRYCPTYEQHKQWLNQNGHKISL